MPNTHTLIDFRGDHGTPYAVYESELDRAGKVQLVRDIFKPHPAQIQFFSATLHRANREFEFNFVVLNVNAC